MANISRKSVNRVSKAKAFVSNNPGLLYVVATPIGNLEDITYRAIRVLSEVDLIAAEDTRHARKLLSRFGITTRTTAFHEHNELHKIPELIDVLRQGKCIALISDAGTPLVSDPGFRLVRALRAEQVPVVPIPGPCAAIAALSVAGLPSDRFAFDGFPPAKPVARETFFGERQNEARTLIFYETPHRISASLRAMVNAFGRARPAVLARELTKKFETIRCATLGELCDWIANESDQRRGEFVVIVHGATAPVEQPIGPEAQRVLRILLRELPVKQAAAMAAEITGHKKRALYRLAFAAGHVRP